MTTAVQHPGRISKAAGWCYQPEKAPDGTTLCRWCRGPITEKRRRTFCSDDCVHEHKIRSDPGYVRSQVFKRDHGICAECGLDTEAMFKALQPLIAGPSQWFRYHNAPMAGMAYHAARRQGIGEETGIDIILLSAMEAVADRLRITSWKTLTRSLWQADHIVPVAEGGGQCGLDGYRTLCIGCHTSATQALRARLWAAKKQKWQETQDGR